MASSGIPNGISAEFALTNASIPHSGSVAFFNGLPRWSGSEPDVQLDSLTAYVLEISFSAIIPIIAFVAVLVLCFTLLAVRNSCLSLAIDQRLVNRRKIAPKEKLGHLVFSTILIHLFWIFLAFGVVGAIVLAESSLNVSSALSSFVEDVRRTGLSLIDLVQWMKARILAFQPSTLNDDTDAGKFLEIAFSTLVEYVPKRFPDVAATRIALANLLQDILDVISILADYVVWAFTAMTCFTLVTTLALVFTFTAGMFTRRRTCCTIVLFVLFMLLPLSVSWTFFGVWTGAGIGLADGCRMIDEYRNLLRTGVQTNTTTNALMDTHLACPSKEEAAKLQSEMNMAANSIVDNPLAADTMALLLDIKDNQLGVSATWTATAVGEYINCNILVRFSGRLESLICGSRRTSLITGIRYLWNSSLMISIVVTSVFCAGVLGYPVIWTATVWALPPMDSTFVNAVGSEVESGDHDDTGKLRDDEESGIEADEQKNSPNNVDVDAVVAI
jgi:hypothetical protein